MLRISPHVQHAAGAIRSRNRFLKRPLSLLYVKASDIGPLLAWEPWLRRVAVFSYDEETHYRLVAAAVGLDLFTRFNFRIAMDPWHSVPSQPVAWPFDIVYVCLDAEILQDGLASPQGWALFLSAQAAVVEEFLLIAEGPLPLVDSVQTMVKQAGPIGGSSLVLNTLMAYGYKSDWGEKGLRIWRVSHKPIRVSRTWSDDELANVSDLMQWGEEVSE